MKYSMGDKKSEQHQHISTWRDNQNQKLEGKQWETDWDGLHNNI